MGPLFLSFNTFILSLIPLALALVLIIFVIKKLTNKKISELENRISNLENK